MYDWQRVAIPMASSLPPIKQSSLQHTDDHSNGNGETEFILNIEPPSDSNRLWARMKKEPWIPIGNRHHCTHITAYTNVAMAMSMCMYIGVGLTTASLLMGLRAMARGDKLQSNVIASIHYPISSHILITYACVV
jgi:hypothetical protein